MQKEKPPATGNRGFGLGLSGKVGQLTGSFMAQDQRRAGQNWEPGVRDKATARPYGFMEIRRYVFMKIRPYVFMKIA